jgi:1-acyl-sn-glycerol-3-phosphate acyltransferase
VAIASVWPGCFVSKQEVRDWPLIGGLSARTGTLFIRRGSEGAAAMVADEITWRLRHGDAMLVFPEGTSTAGATVRRFHPRLFRAAVMGQCPVQAIALRYPDGEGLQHGRAVRRRR